MPPAASPERCARWGKSRPQSRGRSAQQMGERLAQGGTSLCPTDRARRRGGTDRNGVFGPPAERPELDGVLESSVPRLLLDGRGLPRRVIDLEEVVLRRLGSRRQRKRGDEETSVLHMISDDLRTVSPSLLRRLTADPPPPLFAAVNVAAVAARTGSALGGHRCEQVRRVSPMALPALRLSSSASSS
jgi:hypothetical protein